MNFHKKELFTHQQVLDALGITNQIEIVDFSTKKFFNWETYLNKFYKKMVAGTVVDNHVFLARTENPTTMVIQQYMGAPEEENPQQGIS